MILTSNDDLIDIENSKRGDFKEGCYSVNGAGKLEKKKKINLSASYRTRIYDLPICTLYH